MPDPNQFESDAPTVAAELAGRWRGVTVDVFVPTLAFFDQVRDRRVRQTIGAKPLVVWSADVVAVLRVMSFRGQDLVDVQKMLQFQDAQFDRDWVRERLVEIFGARDPRISAWDDLVARTPPE